MANLDRTLAKGLGLFSLGLGATELFAPKWVGEKTGLGKKTALIRAYGAREIFAGAAVLAQRRPARGLSMRFLGDLLDLATLRSALKRMNRRARRRARNSLRAVIGVTVLDALLAVRMQRRLAS